MGFLTGRFEAPASRPAIRPRYAEPDYGETFNSRPVRRWRISAIPETGTRCENFYLESITKRLFDLTISTFALMVLLPFLVLIALGILATSRGPVFFVQSRGGRGHRSFKMMKFRSMYVQANRDGVVQATPGDPRTTPLGRILRKTSIDELPQLFNVLMGEMSIVGPRPHAVEHDELYGLLIDTYHNRLACKPGITGLAQVNGCRGATPTKEAMARRVELDLEYIETGSLRLDLIIVFRTVWTMLTCRNAY